MGHHERYPLSRYVLVGKEMKLLKQLIYARSIKGAVWGS
jgi:hypothetical protein